MSSLHKITNPDKVLLNGSAKKAFENIKGKVLKTSGFPKRIAMNFPDGTKFRAVYYKTENEIKYFKLCL